MSARMLARSLPATTTDESPARGGRTVPRGLVLIAPAILATDAATADADDVGRATSGTDERVMELSGFPKLATAPLRVGMRAVTAVAAALAFVSARAAILCLRLAITCLIFSGAFWRNGVGAAYHDASKLTESMLMAYRWPAQIKGADRGVACFVLSQMRSAISGGRNAKQAERSEAAAAAGDWCGPTDGEVVSLLRNAEVPILILHGEHDKLVPLSNSRRLYRQLGGSSTPRVRLIEIPECGHCPQEERPELVSAAIGNFAAEIGLLALDGDDDVAEPGQATWPAPGWR